MRLQPHLIAATALGLISILPNGAQATNGYMSHGFGTKSKGMAGAGSALPQDAMISASNVAGGVWLGEQRLDLGMALFSPHREYTQRASESQIPGTPPIPIGSGPDFRGTVESDNELFLIPHLAYSRPLDAVSAFGVVVYGNGGMNTTYRSKDTTLHLGTYGGAQSTPPDASTGVDLRQVGINLNYSRKLREDLSVGAGFILANQSFKAKGLSALGDLAADGVADHLSNRGRDSVFGWGAQVGLLWRPSEQLALSAAYQTQVDFARFDDYADLFADKGNLDAPAFLNLGIAFQPRADLTLAFDIQHIWYSEVKALGNEMTKNIMLCMQGYTAYCLGGSRGVGFGWDDMTVYKFGAQWAMRPDLTLRAGYSYGKQPVPSNGVLFNVIAPAVIEHHFTLGLTKALNKQTELSLAAMYAPQIDLDCGCSLPFSGGENSINIAMDQWEFELSIGIRF
ncbi:aromatic hydrocarbon degradation protein [Caldichromatium japonicum]|uniref:Aromatic hydrocarbon degradation protein n=1 Tax=Caldichromatium japonicum TaxID=2699430 RepID=A0A6G7VAU7_9GAMM|nr:outer membrane protein transport protein [Caldichromatium japonicum]QIK37189.1 aromatic hydrocarbon degradation protein [Caldichromatium japonicum]